MNIAKLQFKLAKANRLIAYYELTDKELTLLKHKKREIENILKLIKGGYKV